MPSGRSLLIVIRDKRFVQCLALGKIQILHPCFRDERLDQLLKDGAVGKELFVAGVMNFWLALLMFGKALHALPLFFFADHQRSDLRPLEKLITFIFNTESKLL